MSIFSRKLLSSLLPTLGQTARWRQRNQLHWDTVVSSFKFHLSCNLKPAIRAMSCEWTPYLAAYEVEQDYGQAIFDQMQKAGLPTVSWPDLPPEVREDQETHAMAWQLRHSRIYLPLHQSIRDHDIATLSPLEERTGVEADKSILLQWDSTSKEQWNEWLQKIEKSNLLQSWEYGEAKRNVEGCRIRRAVFSHNKKAVAIVQVLEKKLFGLFKVSRINRGPLFIDVTSVPLRKAVLRKTKKELSGIHRGRVFSFVPELLLEGSYISLLKKLGLHLFAPIGWESIWVDLRQDKDVLRKNLNGKWRNMLVYAEKQELKVVISSDDSSFNWIINKCHKMMIGREAGSVPELLYRELRKQCSQNQYPFCVLRAFSGDEPLAGICIVPHGDAATYLLGWNSDGGRKLKAHQLLLWKAIIHLKNHGFLWFDLGGINEEEVPGITTFKLGINGERYSLVGEYWN